MANIKKLALGLLVAFLAFGFSAFKSVKTLDNIYGYDYSSGTWRLATTSGFSCQAVTDEPCKFNFGAGSPILDQTPQEQSAEPEGVELGSFEANP